jgi:SWI/SNF-related matrix-associated actin-dependent regulator 1 of chromatin subfamily A
VLIVPPATLKINWEREIKMVYPMAEVYMPEGAAGWDDEAAGFASWIIINYDSLKKYDDILHDIEWAVQIYDEAHYLKNTQSKRSKIVLGHIPRGKDAEDDADDDVHIGLVNNCERVMLLTGTPITSKPRDLFPLLKAIKHPLGRNLNDFTTEYCGAKMKKVGRGRMRRDTSGASNLMKLHQRTKHAILRRVKEECLDLPPKMRVDVPVDIDKREYNRLWEAYVNEMSRKGEMPRAAHLVRMGKLKQAAALGKVDATIELASLLIEAEQKVIIFTCFQAVVDKLIGFFGEGAVKVTGKDKGIKRQEAVDGFQNDPDIEVFVGNIKAASVGLTLTAGTHVIFNDFSWVPSDHLQGEDRAMRIGQKNAVTCHYMIARGTIDERLAEIIAKKLVIISKAIEGKEVSDNDVFGDLVRLLFGAKTVGAGSDEDNFEYEGEEQ